MACAPEALSPAPLVTFARAGRVRNTAVSEEEVDTSIKVRGAQLCRATTLRAGGEACNSPRSTVGPASAAPGPSHTLHGVLP